MRLRKRKDTDDENIEKACKLLIEFLIHNQNEIEATLWYGAMIGVLADNAEKSDVPFEIFKAQTIECIDHYKY
jgi:hypothetical protein